MAQAEVFPFVVTDPAFGEASRLPHMPITLQCKDVLCQSQDCSIPARR